MTSSLVGSEMCIRDRHRPQYEIPRPILVRKTPKRVPIVHISCQSGAAEDCLLYTSDAADDM
eukprot:8954328-Prorocentrum_lima.AAC.1